MKRIKILLIVMVIILLTGCSESMGSKLEGKWYHEGSSTPAFVLYDDGTCEISGEYGSGTWCIVNGNLFKITNFYGESEVATIVSIEKDYFIIEDEDSQVRLWRSPQTIMDKSGEQEEPIENKSEDSEEKIALNSETNIINTVMDTLRIVGGFILSPKLIENELQIQENVKENTEEKIVLNIATNIINFIKDILKYIGNFWYSPQVIADELELGQKYLLEERYAEAIVAFSKVIELEPKSVEAYLGRAESYSKLSETEENLTLALADYERVRELEADNKEAFLGIADIYLLQGDYEAALKILKDGTEMAPEDEQMSARLSEIETEHTNRLYEDILAELVSEYGVFDGNQEGVMRSPEDQWFEPAGVITNVVLDLDSDHQDEMMVFVSQRCEHRGGDYCHIKLYVYDVESGKAVRSDSMVLGAYVETEYYDTVDVEVLFYPDNFCEDFVAVNTVKIDGKIYIVCEYSDIAAAFADGNYQGYWVLEYTDSKLKYVCSFSRTGPGSDANEYIGYKFSDGVLRETELYYEGGYYEEGGFSLYDGLEQALISFFDTYDIKLDFSDAEPSIFSLENDIKKVFEFETRLTDYSFESTYGRFEFSSSIILGEPGIKADQSMEKDGEASQSLKAQENEDRDAKAPANGPVSYFGVWTNYEEAEYVGENLGISFESDGMTGELLASIAVRVHAEGTYVIQEDGTFSSVLNIYEIYSNATARWEPAQDVVYLNGEFVGEDFIKCDLRYEGSDNVEHHYLKRDESGLEHSDFKDDQDYILSESSREYLSKADLIELTAEECRLARNEIYARHGRIFNSEELQEYFESCSWYVPMIPPEAFDESLLNEYEVANRDLIVEYERELIEEEGLSDSTEVAGTGCPDEILIEAAAKYYEAVYGIRPPAVDIDNRNGDNVLIHLYELTDTHWATWDWYNVNQYTGIGMDFMGAPIDLELVGYE